MPRRRTLEALTGQPADRTLANIRLSRLVALFGLPGRDVLSCGVADTAQAEEAQR
jgi:hypothetical protein